MQKSRGKASLFPTLASTTESCRLGSRGAGPMTTPGCGVELAVCWTVSPFGATCVPVYRTLAAIEDKVEIKHHRCTLTLDVPRLTNKRCSADSGSHGVPPSACHMPVTEQHPLW